MNPIERRVLRAHELPRGLSEMAVPPDRAYLWGALPPPPWVSIVGTRRPTEAGLRAAFYLARRLARAGVTIVSGGALGIDTAAHLGAMAGRGPTLVVAPVWWDGAYPKENRSLFHAIVRHGGGYLTVSERETLPLSRAFFHRNEALTALSHAVVLGECPHKSGAKNAMFHARSLLRPRFALPFTFLGKRGRGTWDEIVHHGAEILVDERPVLRMLEEYGPFDNARWWHFLGQELLRAKEPDVETASPRKKRGRPPGRRSPPLASRQKSQSLPEERIDPCPPQQRLVIDAVMGGGVNADLICARTGLSPQAVQHEIILLLLDGRLSEDERGLLRYHSRPK